MDQKRVGKFICEIRKEKGLTQEKLAEILNVSSKSISRWENGITLPDYAILKRLSEILGVSISEIFEGERISKNDIIKKYEKNLVQVLEEYAVLKKQRDRMKCILSIVAIIAMVILSNALFSFGMFGIMDLSFKNSEVSIITDIKMYENVIGDNVDSEYTFKSGKHEAIFPKCVDMLEIIDFQMVYYNPWDPQYLAYLVVEYSEDEYEKEMQRLIKLGVDDYYDEYGTTGFGDNELVALSIVDQHYGMVYAIKDDLKNTITYVEMFFCNFCYDLDYEEYIPNEYLPDGFDATRDNKYMDIYLQEIRDEQKGIF